jgi:HEAT repeat protein
MDKKRSMNSGLILCVFLCVLCDSVVRFSSRARADFDPVIDSPMYHLPDVPIAPEVNVFPDGLKELWLRALERPEADMRYKSADAIALGHKMGMKGLDATIAPLLSALDRPDQSPTVRLALARALIVLEARKEARESASSLLHQAQAGSSDLRELVEPTLARWDYQPVRAVWLDRLREPGSRQRDLVLAIQGLARVREEKAIDRLREMVLSDRVPGPIRLESARALASLRSEGLEKEAEGLAAPPLNPPPERGGIKGGGLVPRLAAASLLRRHSSPQAVPLLQRLLRDPEPTVAAIAGARLLEIDPQLVVPAVQHLLSSTDANLRSSAVDALGRRPNAEHIRLLGDRLDDEHIGVRAKARKYLEKLATDKSWQDLVLAEGKRMIQTRQWRALEQATILLTQLDHKPAVERFLELLSFDRREVSITAAWGLRKLDVPETLPRVLSLLDSHTKPPPGRANAQPGQQSAERLPSLDDHGVSQLNQLLGQRKYRLADPVLRRFIPKRGGASEARAAAVWALGSIHEGETIDDLAAALEARLNDVSAIPPEMKEVRLMSAISLGRMKAKKSLPSLRRFSPRDQMSRERVNNACAWAISQITGEALLPSKPIPRMQRNWFLTPQQ